MGTKQLKTQRKDVNAILKACHKANIEVRKTGGGHFQIYLPTGDIMTIASTPRNINTTKRVVARLKKAGVPL